MFTLPTEQCGLLKGGVSSVAEPSENIRCEQRECEHSTSTMRTSAERQPAVGRGEVTSNCSRSSRKTATTVGTDLHTWGGRVKVRG
jgi:hypothetical protein